VTTQELRTIDITGARVGTVGSEADFTAAFLVELASGSRLQVLGALLTNLVETQQFFAPLSFTAVARLGA
jgi:hypothetical protein